MSRVNSTHEKANYLHHQQRMQDFAQKKLSQLLFYDETNGHFKLVNSALSGADKSTSQSAFGVFDTSKESSQNYKIISADQNFKLQKQTIQRERNIQKRAQILKKQQQQKLLLFNNIRDGIQNKEDDNQDKLFQQNGDQNIFNISKSQFSPDSNLTLDHNFKYNNHQQQIDLKSRKFFMKNEQIENKRNFHKEYQQKLFESQNLIQNQNTYKNKIQYVTQEEELQNQLLSQNYGSELQEQNIQSQNSEIDINVNSNYLIQNMQEVESILQKQQESSSQQRKDQRSLSPWKNFNLKIDDNQLQKQNKDAGTFVNDPESLSYISLKNQKKIFNEENPISKLKPDQYLKFQHTPSPDQVLRKLELIKDELNFQDKQNSVISNYIQANKDYEIQTQKSLLFQQNQKEQFMFINKNSPLKQKKRELKKIGQQFLDKHPAQIQGVDQTQLDFDRIKSANTDFSVTLDFQKEFIHHKRVLCSLREICNFDIQHQWDVGYCKTFCSGLNDQHFSEQQTDLTKEHTYIEKYQSDHSIKNALKNILKERAIVEEQVQSHFAKNYFNEQELNLSENYDELQEGYLNNSKINSNGYGIQNFNDKFVLRFKNQHEISLYFDIVDQLKNILILKGKKEMFINENYQNIMEKFIELCKNYMMFLCKDDEYFNYISNSNENDIQKNQQTFSQKQDQENINIQEKINLNNEYTEEQIAFKLQINQLNRERKHRSFIKAFLFDSIFKIFIQILDEALYNKELLIKIKQKEWKVLENKKLQYFKNEIIDLQLINENLKNEHKIEIDELKEKIRKLKESQIEIQHSLEDYKYDLNRLTQINVREEKIEGLRRHVQDANEFIRLTEIQMEEQEDIIFPVLGMINIVAKNPHFKEQGMQTECQINSFMAHVLTQIDSRSLQDFGNTSLSQMEQVISQIFILKDQEESLLKDEQIIKKKALIQKKKTPKQSSVSMKQLKNKISKNIEQSQGSVFVQNLLKIESEAVTLDELQKQMLSYIQDFEKLIYQSQKNQNQQQHQNWTLGDFICNQLLQENENIIKAAFQLHKLLINIKKPEHNWHPMIKLSKKLIGICGYQKPDQQMLLFLFGLKEQMDVNSINDNTSIQSSIDVIQKSFISNKGLLSQIQENYANYILKSEMDKLRIVSLESIVNEETFGLPKTFSSQQQQKFFKQLQIKFDGQFFHQFTLVILQIIVKLKQQKIEMKKLFSNNPNDEETDSKIVTHTKKDFYSKLTKEGKVVLSQKQKELLDHFIDPEEKSVKNPKTKIDIKHFVELCEKQQTIHILKQCQVQSAQVLNCIYDQIENLLNFQLPFQIEQAVRKKLQVVSTVANKIIIDLDQTQEQLDKKSIEAGNDQTSPAIVKKKSIIDKDLDYHISLDRFKVGLSIINEKMQILQSASSPAQIKEQDNQIINKQSPQNVTKKVFSKPTSPHEQGGHTFQNHFKHLSNLVFDDGIACTLTFLSLQNGKNVLNSLSKDLDGEKEQKYFHFANTYINKYYSIYSNPGNDIYNSRQFIIKDFLKQELVIQTKQSTSKNLSISQIKENKQSPSNAEQQRN